MITYFLVTSTHKTADLFTIKVFMINTSWFPPPKQSFYPCLVIDILLQSTRCTSDSGQSISGSVISRVKYHSNIVDIENERRVFMGFPPQCDVSRGGLSTNGAGSGRVQLPPEY